MIKADGEANRMFNQQEVQILLGGVNSPVDLEDLRKHTNYGGVYDDGQDTIVGFWNVSVPSKCHPPNRALKGGILRSSKPSIRSNVGRC
jgi:ubiquitin-protein ligase E3 C